MDDLAPVAADSSLELSAPVRSDRRAITLARRIAGVLLLTIGLVWLAISLGLPQSSATSSSLNRTLALVIQIAQHALLLGDQALTETQMRFNSVVVTVLIDQLTPTQRTTLSTAASTVRSLLGDLLSPLGLLTIALLVAARVAVGRAIDARVDDDSRVDS